MDKVQPEQGGGKEHFSQGKLCTEFIFQDLGDHKHGLLDLEIYFGSMKL